MHRRLGMSAFRCDDGRLQARSSAQLSACLQKGTNTLKKQRFIVLLFTAFFLFTSSGVASAQQATATTHVAAKPQPIFSQLSSSERIVNIDVLKKEVRQYHECNCTCGCYSRDLDVQANRAVEFLRRRAAHKRANEKLAMVLDIDETSLTNYEELQISGFNYVKKDFDAWVDTAKAPAIPGTLRLYKVAQQLGVSVFFITGRPELQRDVTKRNLREQGYANWQKLILRPASAAAETTTDYKSSIRGQIAAEGYRIVLNVGDQWSDLKGTATAEYSVKYPDPFYLIP